MVSLVRFQNMNNRNAMIKPMMGGPPIMGGGGGPMPPGGGGGGVPPPASAVPEIQIPANIIQTRELLYRLIISQLFYDGYQQVAVTLSNMGNYDNNFLIPTSISNSFLF